MLGLLALLWVVFAPALLLLRPAGATVTVRSETSSTALGSTTWLSIVERPSGKLLARASNSTLLGGRARVVLGAWAARSCPSPASRDGADDFGRFYHLARLTLLAAVHWDLAGRGLLRACQG